MDFWICFGVISRTQVQLMAVFQIPWLSPAYLLAKTRCTILTTMACKTLSVTQTDINGDGRADLVRIDALSDSNAPIGHVIRSSIATSDGFAETFEFETDELMDLDNRFATNEVIDIYLDDFNGDGNLDLLGLLAGFRSTPDAALIVYPGDGTGRFNPAQINTRIGNTLSPAKTLF